MSSIRNPSSNSRLASLPGLARIVAMLVAVTLIFAPLTGCGGGKDKHRDGLSEFEKIKQQAESYLNDSGKELARGKTEGASIYSVDVSLDTEDKSVSGEERVLYTNRTPDTLSEVVFRVYADDAGTGDAWKPTVIEGAKVDGRTVESSLENSVLAVNVPGGIEPGGRAEISFSFNEPIPPAGQDETEGLFAYGEGTYDLGYFLPTVVTYSNGAWDKRELPDDGDADNFDCSYYDVSIEAPGNYTVAATGVELESEGGARVFTAGPVRDFEAQASNRYETAKRQVGPTTVTSYYYENHADSGAIALDAGCDALGFYSDHFGPYPYTRFNICEAPIEPDGAEYTGQIQMASYVYDDPDYAEDLEGTVAHEVCHQWWALGVGSDAIGLPWLDESLTSYCEGLYWLWLEGEESAEEAFSEIADNYISARDDDVPDAVVEQPVSAFESGDQYTSIVYGKGPFFFDELWQLLGASGFDKSLSEYYRKSVFLNATTQDLLTAFRANSGEPAEVDALYQRWIRELHGDEDMFEE